MGRGELLASYVQDEVVRRAGSPRRLRYLRDEIAAGRIVTRHAPGQRLYVEVGDPAGDGLVFVCSAVPEVHAWARWEAEVWGE